MNSTRSLPPADIPTVIVQDTHTTPQFVQTLLGKNALILGATYSISMQWAPPKNSGVHYNCSLLEVSDNTELDVSEFTVSEEGTTAIIRLPDAVNAPIDGTYRIKLTATSAGWHQSALSRPFQLLRYTIAVGPVPMTIYKEHKDEKVVEVQIHLKNSNDETITVHDPFELDFCLLYDSGEQVKNQDILRVHSTDSVRIVSGCTSVRLQITDVSKNHQRQRFRVEVHAMNRMDIGAAVTDPILVLSKKSQTKRTSRASPKRTASDSPTLSGSYSPHATIPTAQTGDIFQILTRLSQQIEMLNQRFDQFQSEVKSITSTTQSTIYHLQQNLRGGVDPNSSGPEDVYVPAAPYQYLPNKRSRYEDPAPQPTSEPMVLGTTSAPLLHLDSLPSLPSLGPTSLVVPSMSDIQTPANSFSRQDSFQEFIQYNLPSFDDGKRQKGENGAPTSHAI